MKKLRKFLALSFAVIMLLSAFSGCKKPENPSSSMPEFIYVPTYSKFNLPEGTQWINYVAVSGDKIYFSADSYQETERTDETTGETYMESVYAQKVFSSDLEGKEVKELAAFGTNNRYTEEMQFDEYVNRIFADEKGVYVLVSQNTTTFNLPDNFNPEIQSQWEFAESSTSFVLYTIDNSGNVDEGKVIFELDPENDFYPDSIIHGDNGNWYVSSYLGIRVYDPDFNELYRIDTPEGGGSLIKIKDGSIGSILWTENGQTFNIINDSKKAFDEPINLPQDIDSFRGGNGVYDIIYNTSNGGGIGYFNFETGESETILNWLDSDVDSSYIYGDRIVVVDTETVVAIEESWTDNGTEYNIIHLKKTPSSEIPEKKIISLACIYLDYDVRREILEFNKTNSEYRIHVTDYSEFASGEDYYGLTKLNTEIISGNIPDIFITNNMPMARYSGKGIFEDLTPYIEQDIGFDNLVSPLFDALRTEDGKLYEIYDNFNLYTYFGLKNVVGDGSSWTFDDLKAAFEKLPEGATVFEKYVTKANAFSLLFSNNVENFVNWETGECRFTDKEFIDILEFTENFPLEEPPMDDGSGMYYYYSPTASVLKGEQLLANAYFYNVDDFRANTFYVLGDNVSFVGLPTNEGSGNYFSVYGGLAMSATSEHKEVVWNFISRILTEEYQTKDNYYDGIPTNKAAFDKMIEKSMTPEFDEFYVPFDYENNFGGGIMTKPALPDGEVPVEETVPEENENAFSIPEYSKGQTNEKGWHEVPKSWGWLEYGTQHFEYPVYAMTEAEYNIIMDIINNTTRISRYDESVMKIINEEIEYFFNGERTAQQTAEYIQSRVNLYVNEQR
ncbi:MAG: extracellular solute-binding protein [Oscillospiraceae bacterium]|nr:extracellular solute-binding protein [Oscillospiraceae bacterium]MBP1574739.1 extracellular solute-binding protein [Oscillospiraceae bacterium]